MATIPDIETTVKAFAEKMKIDVLAANGFLKFLEARGVAKKIREQRSESGKGKPAAVYSIPAELNIKLY